MRRRRNIAGIAAASALAVAGCYHVVEQLGGDGDDTDVGDGEDDVRGCTRERCLRGSLDCCPDAIPGMWYLEWAWCSCFGAADADGDVDEGADAGLICVPPCPDGGTCCPGGCADLTSDPDNCGRCGIRCLDDDPPLADSCITALGRTRCSCAGSASECRPDQQCCPEGCRAVMSDPSNCGACGNACPPGEICRDGGCTCGALGTSCPDGQTCCYGECSDTASDVENCGGCGYRCDPWRTDGCVAGVCRCGTGEPCAAPMVRCYSSPDEHCCAGSCQRFGTAEACAACDTPCPDGQTCRLGPGRYPPCDWVCE